LFEKANVAKSLYTISLPPRSMIADEPIGMLSKYVNREQVINNQDGTTMEG